LRSASGKDRQISNFSGSTVCGFDTVAGFSDVFPDVFSGALAESFFGDWILALARGRSTPCAYQPQ